MECDINILYLGVVNPGDMLYVISSSGSHFWAGIKGKRRDEEHRNCSITADETVCA
jgi:hypothetical protein